MARSAFFLVVLVGTLWFSVSPATLPEKKLIPTFQTTLLDGRKVTVKVNKEGQLVVIVTGGGKKTRTYKPRALLLDFWATWCPPCRQLGKWLKALHKRYAKKGLFILGISVDEQGKRVVAKYVKDKKVPYWVALDPKAKVAATIFKVELLPTLYVINRKGIIVKVFEGLPDGEKALLASLKGCGIP